MFHQQFFTHLAKDGIALPRRYKEEIIKIFDTLNCIPRIGIFGKNDTEKSSPCNALPGEDICKVSGTGSCIQDIQDIKEMHLG